MKQRFPHFLDGRFFLFFLFFFTFPFLHRRPTEPDFASRKGPQRKKDVCLSLDHIATQNMAADDATAAPSSSSERYVVVNGLRYAVPHLHAFVIKVSEKRVGGSVAAALAAHVKFQGQVGDGGRDFWAGAGRVRRDMSHHADEAAFRNQRPSFTCHRVK